MWMEKLAVGVLRVQTPLGPRYIAPTFWQRVQLLWIFRNFEVLPLQVLTPWQQRLIDELCAERRFVSLSTPAMMEDAPVLGTVERRPPVEVERAPERKQAAGEVATPFAADVRQRS
jgi:hypothetical protein